MSIFRQYQYTDNTPFVFALIIRLHDIHQNQTLHQQIFTKIEGCTDITLMKTITIKRSCRLVEMIVL